MTPKKTMPLNERRKYLRGLRRQYLAEGRKEKGRLLDEMEAVTGLHRKYLIRLMNGSLQRKPRRRQRGKARKP